MPKAEWIRIPALSDNYIWMLHNPSSGAVAIIDPAEAAPVIKALDDRGLTPTEIINTHHHNDHIGGNAELRDKYNIPLTAPKAELNRIPDITHAVSEGDHITIAGYSAEVIATPGHTSGHVVFYLPDCFGDHGIAFVGDNLFSLGCGRVFEGSMEEMWSSLCKIKNLPDDTIICGGHEYSAANADYVEHLNWPRPAAAARIVEIRAMRAEGTPTLPVRLGDEKNANPFLNCHTSDLADALGVSGQDGTAVFTRLRKGKDEF